MRLMAKCKTCGWQVTAVGSVVPNLAAAEHRKRTGHEVKIKGADE